MSLHYDDVATEPPVPEFFEHIPIVAADGRTIVCEECPHRAPAPAPAAVVADDPMTPLGRASKLREWLAAGIFYGLAAFFASMIGIFLYEKFTGRDLDVVHAVSSIFEIFSTIVTTLIELLR